MKTSHNILKKYIPYCLILAVLSVSQGFADDLKSADWGAATNNLQMSISLEGGEHQIKAGQPYCLMIRYKNNTTNETFEVYEVNGTVDDHTYSFVVTSPSGKDISPDRSKIQWPDSGGHHSVLPGQIIEIKFNMNKVFNMDEVGTYKVTVKKAKIGGNKIFEAVSNPLKITVVSDQ